MADFLCEDFNEDDFDTNCTPGPGPGVQSTRVIRSPRYGLTRVAATALLLLRF